jgi:putative tricarboxylic transport membrane protein
MQLLDNKDRIGSLLVLAFALVYLRYALVLPLDPTAGDDAFTARTLPVGLSVAAILFAIIQLFLSTRKGAENRISTAVHGFSWRPMLWLVLLMAVYSVVFDLLGFILSSFLFLQLGFLILGERRILMSTAIAAGLVLFLWVMLNQVFGLYLDSGDLYRALFGKAS